MRFWGIQRFHFFNSLYIASIKWCFRIDPKRHEPFFYVLYSWRVAVIAVDVPHSYLLSLHKKVLKGFSNNVDILEIICHVCFPRQICIRNKHVIIFPRINQRQRKFDMYLIVSFLFYIKKKKEKKVYFFSLFLSDNKLFRPYMVFEFAQQKFVTYISLIIH